MNRRTFLVQAFAVSVASGVAARASAVSYFFPTPVDKTLFDGINRIKDHTKKTGLEKGHAPVISAPKAVKSNEPFIVEVTVGENLHPMGSSHWIEYIELNIGNEPAGRAEFQSRGFAKPRVVFSIAIPKEAAPDGKVSLVARENCNLHGLWESSVDIVVS